MKNLKVLLLFLFVVSCANEPKNANKPELDIQEEPIGFNGALEAEYRTIGKLTAQKLEEYFELVKLGQKHPEFKEGIESRLQELSGMNIVDKYGDNFAIDNIQQIGDIMIISDSVQKVSFRYEVILENEKLIDSIEARVVKATTLMDSVETPTMKVTFHRLGEPDVK